MPTKPFSGVGFAILSISAVILMVASSAFAQIRFQTLHGFSGRTDGKNPAGGLVMDAAGNLYGTTGGGGAYGHGVVFQLTPSANGRWTEHELYSFTGGSDGAQPECALIFDADGNLYGTTDFGGSGSGVVFKLSVDHNVWTESVLHSFSGTDGAFPFGGLIFDKEGNLYGTTSSGGTGCSYVYGCGAVFELTPTPDGSWTERVLHEFHGGSDGMNPVDTLIFDPAGNLYGTTQGGAAGSSTVFELKPCSGGTWKEVVLHVFTGGKDGGVVWAGLILDAAGNLYGASQIGGIYGWGVVYKLTRKPGGSWSECLLYSFTGGNDGALPLATLAFDSAGSLYGTTIGGGSLGDGVVFKLMHTSAGWSYKQLHAFAGRPGAEPNAGVIFDTAGNVYGTSWGLDNTTYGSVFKITP